MYVLTYEININHKVMDIHTTLHRPKMLNKKEGPNVHGIVSHRKGNKTVIGSRWKREVDKQKD